MAYATPTADFVTTTLNGAITAAATSATIGTGLNLPAANGVLQIDYDSAIAVGVDEGPETIAYTSYTSGTGALAGITRGLAGTTGAAHNNGSAVQQAPSSVFFGSSSQAQDIRSILNPYKARATLAVSQTINDNSATKILLDTETYDVNSNFASNKYTVPVTGYYQVSWNIIVSDAQSVLAWATAYVYKNGAAVVTQTQQPSGASTGSGFAIGGSDIMYLTATDYIEIYALGNTTDSGTCVVTGGANGTYLSVHLLSA